MESNTPQRRTRQSRDKIGKIDTARPRRIVLWVFTALTFGITLFPNYGLTKGLSIFGLNFSSVQDVAHKFRNDITPPSYYYFIWTIVFIWQIVWLVYTGTLIFRKCSRGGHLYYAPPFIHSWMYGAFIISSILDFIWNIFWGLSLVQLCLLCNICQTATLAISLGTSFYSLQKYGQQLVDDGNKKDVFFTIFFVQYGIGLYLCQLSCSLLINVASVITYYGSVSLPTAGAISLSVLLVAIILWFSLDNFQYEKHCRYFFVPYIVAVYFLSGSLAANWKQGAPNSIFTAVLLGLVVALFMIKIVLVIIRSKYESLFYWNSFISAQLEDYPTENTPLVYDNN